MNVIITGSATAFLRGLRTPLRLSAELLQRATEQYLRALIDRHCYLKLQGMGVSDRVPLKLPLLDLYVPLKARLELPEGETWRRETLTVAGREALTGKLSEPVPVLDLLQEHPGLIILGDPGAGKTTFLKYLALQLALGRGGGLSLDNRLPVLVPLSAYANALQKDDVRLDDFIAGYFHGIGADLPIGEIVCGALEQGLALLLLDGLDEVKSPSLRQTVVKRVVDFYSFQRQKGNKFVLTSRIVGYRDVRPTEEGLGECTLVDFDNAEIETFVRHWTVALESQAQGAASDVARTDAHQEEEELLSAVQRHAGVRRLASNPLLLTILALMKRQGVTLPERRVELYDQYVKTLLSSWNRARGLDRPPSHDLDVVQTMRILAPLALWMHQVNPGVGLVKREDLRRQLLEIYAERGIAEPEAAAQQFLLDVREYAGLLLERGPGEYGFIHLTFEEYLSAVAIALQGQGSCRPIVDALSAHIGDQAWREVSLLTVAYVGIIQQLDRVAGDVVEALIAEQPGELGEAVVLAGEAVLDAGESGVPLSSRERVIQALVETMQSGSMTPLLRRRAGLALGNLGWQTDDLDVFVEVLPGKFLYGDEKEEREIPYRYWIGRYPVTNAQYARFVADGGYERQEFWSAEGWKWREQEDRVAPVYWQNSKWNNPIFPVVGVTQYEAQAYCRWLDAKLRDDAGCLAFRGAGGEVLQADGAEYRLRLPTELEWERAARGTEGREYPWGEEFDVVCANVGDIPGKAGGTNAVSTYPQGVSPVGAWDMSGNVWEWTASGPVLRGGSWYYHRRLARCAYRYRLNPNSFLNFIGFRLVVSLVDSEF